MPQTLPVYLLASVPSALPFLLHSSSPPLVHTSDHISHGSHCRVFKEVNGEWWHMRVILTLGDRDEDCKFHDYRERTCHKASNQQNKARLETKGYTRKKIMFLKQLLSTLATVP